MKINRRDLLRGAPFAAGAALLGHATGWPGAELFAQNFGLASLPSPEESGIEHIVVVMMENRSFDHFLGWLPNADGQQAGLSYLDAVGVAHSTHSLAPDFTGCTHPDPDHSYLGGRVQYDGGAMDGFLRSGKNDDYAIGFYVERDRPFYSALARNYTTLDHSRIHPRPHVSQSILLALRADGPPDQRPRWHCPADHMGPAARGRSQRSVLLLQLAIPGFLGP